MSLAPIQMIEVVAEGLDSLLDEIVFVGGAITSLYYKDSVSPMIRPTEDVDCVIEISSRAEYNKLEEELRNLGLRHDTSQGAPICRWIYNNVKVDVMPTDHDILGFTNIWYSEGIKNAIKSKLPSGKIISIFTMPYFIAAKLEAHKSRGSSDIRWSHDFEDIVLVLDNQKDFEEIFNAPKNLKNYFNQEFRNLQKDDQLFETIQSSFGYSKTGSSRAERIMKFMKEISK